MKSKPIESNAEFIAIQFDGVFDGVLGPIFRQSIGSGSADSPDGVFVETKHLIKLSILAITTVARMDFSLIDRHWPIPDRQLLVSKPQERTLRCCRALKK